MKLSGAYQIPGSREAVFKAITDPEILKDCIDGCEKMVLTGDDLYDAHLKIGLGSIKGSYVGKVHLRDKEPPEHYTLVMEGKGAPGFVKGTAKIVLTESGAETKLTCDADALVGGLIAAIGSRLIEAAAKKMMHEFFRKFGETMKGLQA